MKKFLVDQGFTPLPIVDLSDLGHVGDDGVVRGAVISTSLTATQGESYADVFRHIRKEYPGLPVIFATMGNPDDMIGPIGNALSSESLKAEVLEVKSANRDHPSLGKENTFLLVHKNCVAKPEAIEMTAGMIAKHFGSAN
jgi:hypothetical protein